MAYKDLLLVLRSYPTATPDETIRSVVDLAASWQARLSAIACGVVPRGAHNPLRHLLIDISTALAEQSNTSVADAQRMLATFRSAARKRGVPGETIFERCELSAIARVLVDHARMRDLTILAIAPDDYLAEHDLNVLAETMVFDSGHPALILPKASTERSGPAFDRIVIAWDGSRASARAVADAMPLLMTARTVRILTIANKKTVAALRTAPALAQHLAAHGVKAVLDCVTSSGRRIETVFADYVALHSADLLVMGGYGESRLREFILGGATRSLLSAPPTALFLSH